MTTSNLEFQSAIVATARDKLHKLIRAQADQTEVESALNQLQDAQELLAEMREGEALLKVEKATVEEAVRSEDEAKAIAQSRVNVAKVTNRMARNIDKFERAVEIAFEAYAGLSKQTADAFAAMHPSDKGQKQSEAFRQFRQKLLYAFQVQLTAAGLPVLGDTSIVRSHQKIISPRSVVEGFINTVKR